MPQGLPAVRVEHHVQQWAFEDVGSRLRAPGHDLPVHGFGVEQFPAHAGVLTALTGEQPGGFRRVPALPARQPRARTVLGERAEQLIHARPGVDDQRGAMA